MRNYYPLIVSHGDGILEIQIDFQGLQLCIAKALDSILVLSNPKTFCFQLEICYRSKIHKLLFIAKSKGCSLGKCKCCLYTWGEQSAGSSMPIPSTCNTKALSICMKEIWLLKCQSENDILMTCPIRCKYIESILHKSKHIGDCQRIIPVELNQLINFTTFRGFEVAKSWCLMLIGSNEALSIHTSSPELRKETWYKNKTS